MQLDQGDEASRSFWAGLGLRGNSLKNGSMVMPWEKLLGAFSYRLYGSLGVLFIPIHPYMVHLPTILVGFYRKCRYLDIPYMDAMG